MGVEVGRRCRVRSVPVYTASEMRLKYLEPVRINVGAVNGGFYEHYKLSTSG